MIITRYGSSGWWWLSPGDGSSGWPVGVLPVHDLWLWTSAPGKGFNTQLAINNILNKCVIIDYWPYILIHSARVSILALYFSNWARWGIVWSTTGSWTRPWCTSWATGLHHNSWIDKMNVTLQQTLLRFTPHCKIIYNFKNNIAQIHAARRLEPWRPGLVLAPLVGGDLNILFLWNILLWEVISIYFSYRTSFYGRWLWYKVKGLSQKRHSVYS